MPAARHVLVSKESTVRFDALLEDTVKVAHLILESATDTLNSSFPSGAITEEEWGGWRGEGDQAIIIAVKEALSGAAGSVYDQMEEELVVAAARGVVHHRVVTVQHKREATTV